MVNRRSLSWSGAMRDVRGDRMPRAGIREERLRATTALRQAAPLTSWRGRSGRRYVVGIHPTLDGNVADLTEAVLIAVHRSGDGEARVVDVASAEPGTTRRSRLRWLALMRIRGATEMHVHLLADGEAERDAIRRDLASA